MYLKVDVILAKIADGVNVTDEIILNDYFRGDKDILHENNFDEVLNLMNKIKSVFHSVTRKPVGFKHDIHLRIYELLVDGLYIDSQRVIAAQESLRKGKLFYGTVINEC